MSEKHTIEVLIGGKVYRLGGYESEEYIQKVANFLNTKLEEIKTSEGYQYHSAETRNILMYLNLADEYFKAKKKVDAMQEEVEMKDRLLYDLKHEVIDAQLSTEASENTLKDLQQENSRLKKQILKLETELDTLKKQ